MKLGTKVRMTEDLKRRFREHGSRGHVREFGHLTGTVVQKSKDIEHWPEVQVTWGDTGLRYLYDPDDLEVIE